MGRSKSGLAVVSRGAVAPQSGLLTQSLDGMDNVQWIRGHSKGLRTAKASPALLREPMAANVPVRQGTQYQNRLNQHGLYFWQRTGEHVWYESALELASLVDLDQQGEAIQVAAQPFRLLFRRSSPRRYHDPDFFAVLTNGDQVVYDVKPTDRITASVAEQFEETARLCRLVGWRHLVLTESDAARTANLSFLRANRHVRCHPDPQTLALLMAAFASPRNLRAGAIAVSPEYPALAMPYIHHLIWHGVLKVDLQKCLDFTSSATTEAGATCCG